MISEYIQNAEDNFGDEPFSLLTSREREVLQLIAEGNSTREIAALLYISDKTVRSHRAALRDKLGTNSTARLTQYALQKGLISADAYFDPPGQN